MVLGEVHISELIGRRYDTSYVLYLHKLLNYKYPIAPLYSFLEVKPQYGAGEAGIPRIDASTPRYIRITDIDEHGFLSTDMGVTANTIEEKYILNNNDILIARSGNTVGKSYIHKTKLIHDTCFFAGYLIRFVVDSEKILPDYVYIFTKLSSYADWVKVTQRIAGQPNINAEEYGNLMIPVPPIDTQRNIANIFLHAVEKRQKKLYEAKELINGINDYLMSVVKIIPKTEERVAFLPSMHKLSSIIGGRYDPQQFHPERVNMIEQIQQKEWRRLRDVVASEKSVVTSLSQDEIYVGMENIDGETGEYLPLKDKTEISSAVSFHKGDILFPKLRPYLNKVYRAQFSGCCSTEFHVFQARDIDPNYLTIVLRSKMVLAQTKHLMTGNTLPRLQTVDIDNLIIPYPDIKVQREIVESVTKIMNRARKLQKEGNALLENAKKEIEKLIIA